MYVCICRRVTDKTIRQCVREGADSVEQVARMSRAGTDCGSCHEMIGDLVSDERRHLPMCQLLTQLAS